MVSSRVLVTGATGFLGGKAARRFAARGMDVIGSGREPARGAELTAAGVRFAPVALSDVGGLTRLCRDVETVVHCAALSTAWAPRAHYWEANVVGTRNLIAASVAAGVKRFVHVSSPAVLSRLEHQFDLSEDEPLPEKFTSLYGETKAAAERLVGACRDLETAIIRPKAIVGPGDRALLPRLVEAAESGRLRVVGDGSTMTDMTHVDDVVQALTLLVEAPLVSGIYHVTGGAPVRLWELIDEILTRLGMPVPTRRLSLDRAMRIGWGLEAVWTSLRLRGEPPLTRYKAAILGYSQTLDTTRIRTELGYQPQVTLEAGMTGILNSLQHSDQPAGHAPALVRPTADRVSVTTFSTGVVQPPQFTLGRWRARRAPLPVLAAAIAHDRIGLILFDSGFGAVDGMRGVVGRTYRRLLRPESATLASSLHRAGLDPGAVACVVVSHLDPDHVGGLAELPEATVIMDTGAWAALAGPARLWHRLAKQTLPPDLAGRVRLIDTSRGPVDLFADGTLVAITLPGHAAGHIGLLVAARGGHRYALVGDAVLRVADLEHGVVGPYRWIARDRRSLDATVTRLRALAADGLVVVPSHCPDTADLLADGWRTEAHSERAPE